MWLANLLRQFVIVYLKFLLAVAALLIVLGYLKLWWRSVQSSPSALLACLVLCALASVAAHVIRKSKRTRPRQESRRGAERTPLLPQEGGDEQ